MSSPAGTTSPFPTPAPFEAATALRRSESVLAVAERIGQSAVVNRPLLKQFTELAAADFEAFPVWVAVHVADYDEPWSHDTDEETFRPYTGTLPADPTELVLVAATATLDDGTVFPAFLTPSELAGDLARLQPHVFVGGESYGFWGGAFGIPEARRREFLARAGKHERDVFPIRFTADPTLSNGVTETAVPGWL